MSQSAVRIASAVPESFGGLPRTLYWEGGDDGALLLLDQTRLPLTVSYRRCESSREVWEAIRELCVRGAPAIGVAAAFGLCLGTRSFRSRPIEQFRIEAERCAAYLESSRPTAVNLSWAVRRALSASVGARSGEAAWAAMLGESRSIAAEDAAVCRAIGEHGAHLVPAGGCVLTHCNAGALATSAHGTALSILYAAKSRGTRFRVLADETRPLLQGARLTAFELSSAGIEVDVICDGAAASLIRRGLVQMVVVGADRIAANGDTANKIGTYGLALAAAAHGVPFYVAAPSSTFDLSLGSGDEIPIEERAGSELEWGLAPGMVASGAGRLNPAFDVTPGGLIRGMITEIGVLEPVSEENIREIVGSGTCKGG